MAQDLATGAIPGVSDPDGDPFRLFDAWFAEARDSEPNDANAMALATATPDGIPSARMVLLKDHAPEEGFTFYTNCLLYTSPSPRDATLSRMPSSA